MSQEPEEAKGAEGSAPKKDTRSIIEKLRAEAAAKARGGAEQPAGGALARDAGQVPDSAAPAKPMSKLEAIRAAAAKKAAKSDAPALETGPKADAPAQPKAEVKAKPAPEKPARPAAKPEKPKMAAAEPGSSRRTFITWIGAAWTAFTGGCVAALGATVRFLYPNVLQEPPNVFKIGDPDKFEDGNVYEQWKNEYGVWIVKNDGRLFALRTVCTHLGCTPNWLEGEQKFKCPCHGSGFRKSGMNFEGPAPRPLERFTIGIAEDGQVQIDKSKKWQYELGQWTKENGAFVEV